MELENRVVALVHKFIALHSCKVVTTALVSDQYHKADEGIFVQPSS